MPAFVDGIDNYEMPAHSTTLGVPARPTTGNDIHDSYSGDTVMPAQSIGAIDNYDSFNVDIDDVPAQSATGNDIDACSGGDTVNDEMPAQSITGTVGDGPAQSTTGNGSNDSFTGDTVVPAQFMEDNQDVPMDNVT